MPDSALTPGALLTALLGDISRTLSDHAGFCLYAHVENDFARFRAEHPMTEPQAAVVEQLLRDLRGVEIHCFGGKGLLPVLQFFWGESEGGEAIFYHANTDGISYVAVDADGDTMYSYSSRTDIRAGKRVFFDYVAPDVSLWQRTKNAVKAVMTNANQHPL